MATRLSEQGGSAKFEAHDQSFEHEIIRVECIFILILAQCIYLCTHGTHVKPKFPLPH